MNIAIRTSDYFNIFDEYALRTQTAAITLNSLGYSVSLFSNGGKPKLIPDTLASRVQITYGIGHAVKTQSKIICASNEFKTNPRKLPVQNMLEENFNYVCGIDTSVFYPVPVSPKDSSKSINKKIAVFVPNTELKNYTNGNKYIVINDAMTNKQLADVFNQCDSFLCGYNTGYEHLCLAAALCGAMPILINSKIEDRETACELLKFGVAFGMQDLHHAFETFKYVPSHIKYLNDFQITKLQTYVETIA